MSDNTEMTDRRLTDHEARIAWLELELARIAPKVDAGISMQGLDTPTPKPPD
jgi:hypothetical protein